MLKDLKWGVALFILVITMGINSANATTYDHPLGNTVQKDDPLVTDIVSRLRRNPDNIYSTNKTIPRQDFIDIASYQDWMTQDDFKTLKALGVKGVCIKITEFTTYTNPYAKTFIQYASNAGLVVSAYHYSHFASDKEAVAEANYFASVSASLGLPKTTVMVNDAEDKDMHPKGVDPTKTSIAFANRLKSLGYNNVIHYSSLSWVKDNTGFMEPQFLGGLKNFWIAQYPYTPKNTQMQNTQASSWQFSSTMYFVGLSQNKPLDVSVDYTGKFTKLQLQYYTSNPGKVALLKDRDLYADLEGKQKDTAVKASEILEVKGAIRREDETYVLQLKNDKYLTADKRYVVKVTDTTLKNYYYKSPKKVSIKAKSLNIYKNADFTKKTGNSYKQGNVVSIVGVTFSANGLPKLQTSKGYISANKNDVIQARSDVNKYLTSKPTKVAIKKHSTGIYKDILLKKKSKVLKKNNFISVSSIVYTSTGIPRLKVSGGYVVATKDNLFDLTSREKKYLIVQNGTVRTKTRITLYKDANLKKRKYVIAKNVRLRVTGITFDKNGYPRLKVSGGYITASKSYVKR